MLVIALELGAIRPAFLALTMLMIVFPEATVITAITVHVVAEAMCQVILELALINFAI